MFNIITITCGRQFYLSRLLHSIYSQDYSLIKEHKIVFQNGSFDSGILVDMPLEYAKKINCVEISDKKSVGFVLNNYTSGFVEPLTVKLDDDAILRSQDFFLHAKEISTLIPNSVFSPFPVGLINNLGGVPSSNRFVEHGGNTNTFYTFRRVNHVGGFARICPTKLLQDAKFSDSHNEDTEFSSFCASRGVSMFYLENSLIVEHQESTLGQHARYGEAYFKGRF